jgi:hypothetical protein
MGSRDAKAYLASPAVVAASAVDGHITGPLDLGDQVPAASFRDLGWAPPVRPVEIRDGFPERIREARPAAAGRQPDRRIYGKDVLPHD